MSFRGREERRHGRSTPPGDLLPAARERRRERRSSGPWLLLVVALLLFVLLAVAVALLWRALGDTLSGTSVLEDSINAGSKPRVRLVNGPGQVRVEGAEDLGAVEYEVTRYATGRDPASAKENASEVPVNVSREESTIVVETGGGRNTGADYGMRVPSGAAVEVESEAGDVEVSGLSGSIAVLAEAGDVTIRGAGGDIGIEAPQGDVSVSNVNTDTGQVELRVGSGDVTLQDLVIGTLEARIEAGDARLSGRFSGGGRILVRTGSIDVDLPAEDAKDLSLEARFGEIVREDRRSERNGEG